MTHPSRGGPSNALVVGAGRRVLEVALPAFLRLRDAFRVRRILARGARPLPPIPGLGRGGGERLPDVEPFERLDAAMLDDIDLVYVAVAKGAVPAVLARLARFDVSRIDLLIETPVVAWKHFRHAALAARFRHAWVAEDCAWLPWFDLVRTLEQGPLGRLERAHFHRSAFKYHGLAMLKTLFGDGRVVRARANASVASPSDGATVVRTIHFAGGATGIVGEPRDYATGSFVLRGTGGVVMDREGAAELTEGALLLEPVVQKGLCRGFRAGEHRSSLSDDEAELAGTVAGTVTANMEAWKRIGFLRLLDAIARGAGAYAIGDGLDDMLVDAWLERARRYRSTPLTRSDARPGRLLYTAASWLAGR